MAQPSFQLPSAHIGKLWARVPTDLGFWRPQSPSDLGTLLDHTFFASLHTEEGRPVVFAAALLSKDEALQLGDAYEVLAFESPQPATPRSIAKLSLAADLSRTHLGLTMGALGPEVWGMLRPTMTAPKGYKIGFPYILARAVRPGVIQVRARAEDLMFYAREQARIPRGGDDEHLVAYALATHWPLPWPLPFDWLHKGILAHGHGGAIFVLPADSDISNLDIKYRVVPFGPHKRDPATAALLRNYEDPWQEHCTTLARLSAIDGAVLIDAKLHLLGFGVFVTEPDAKVDLVDERGHALEIDGGARHRSAVWFCKRWPDALALVVSQDGGASLFARRDGASIVRRRLNEPG